MHRFSLRVRYGDTDQMGFAYYANYLRWFEIGRAEMMRDLGMSYQRVEDELGVTLPVVEAACRYRRPARYDDTVVIETAVADLKRASVRFAYRVVREDGELLAEGHTEHCFLTREGRPTRMPRELETLIERAPRE
ncbi:MAG: acyl-CoA thioesterase [Candidatus Eisenbacteria bacterium]